jgi:hypothetical protein
VLKTVQVRTLPFFVFTTLPPRILLYALPCPKDRADQGLSNEPGVELIGAWVIELYPFKGRALRSGDFAAPYPLAPP